MTIAERVIYEVDEENFAILVDLVKGLVLGWEARDFLETHDSKTCTQCSFAVRQVLRGVPETVAARMLCGQVQRASQRADKATALVAEWTRPR